ncbi:MAG: hypothetical protein IT367_20070 [Candidatus Hydrogenedentes bacterium]|nr:hypothetical protein [Candidatus Hydrogenedentota bacterium]
MPITPEPAYQLLIVAIVAGVVSFLLYLVHRFWKVFNIRSLEEDEADHLPFDNYCTLLEIAERFQHIADLAAQRATICRNTADRMQRDNGRQWKARHRGAPLVESITKLLTRTTKDESLEEFKRQYETQPVNNNGTHKPKPIMPGPIVPRTHRPCCVCNKVILDTDPVRMDPENGNVYHDKCAVTYTEMHG